jgi:transcriptional regulator with XRE-family HTH domain
MEKWYVKAKKRMQERGMLVKDLGETLGLTASGAGHYLVGRRNPTPDMLRNIARALDMSIAELIEEDPDFARNDEERATLSFLRQIPEERRSSAIAMLRGLATPPPDSD